MNPLWRLTLSCHAQGIAHGRCECKEGGIPTFPSPASLPHLPSVPHLESDNRVVPSSCSSRSSLVEDGTSHGRPAPPLSLLLPPQPRHPPARHDPSSQVPMAVDPLINVSRVHELHRLSRPDLAVPAAQRRAADRQLAQQPPLAAHPPVLHSAATPVLLRLRLLLLLLPLPRSSVVSLVSVQLVQLVVQGLVLAARGVTCRRH